MNTATKGKRILIIDDEPAIRESFSVFLTSAGFITDTAEDGVVGLEKIQNNHYDLVLLDLKMPNLDGIGVLQSIDKNNHPPIYVVTAFSLDYLDQLRDIASSGIDFELLHKPIDGDNLVLAVNGMLI